VTLLGETSDVVSEGFAWLLPVALQILGVARMYMPWKLSVKIPRGSSQLLMMFLGRWSSLALEESARYIRRTWMTKRSSFAPPAQHARR
jgi:hypothetical protein